MARTSKRNPYAHIKRQDGKRSGLESAVAADLEFKGVPFKGEKEIAAITFSNMKWKKYHPDFELPNGIIIETKGWWKTSDRTKHLCIKYQHPEKDIRFVFSNSRTKISKKSNTTYAMFCERNGFRYADKLVPESWIKEPAKPAVARGAEPTGPHGLPSVRLATAPSQPLALKPLAEKGKNK